MAVMFELPADIEKNLRSSLADLDRAAKEATLVDLYRRDEITAYDLSRALGLSRLQTEALLKKHNVTEDLPTADELDSALNRLRQMK
jgi:DNA-binding transcriptional ArsR family regulator